MPSADVLLLPVCAVLALLGVVFTAIAWRRGRRGRVVQDVALTLAPIGLYLSGLLRLLWEGVAAVVSWATTTVFSPRTWTGLAVLGLCAVLWLVGAVVVRRSPARQRAVATSPKAKPVSAGPRPASPAKDQDEDMAEIEALLKSRGIE
jgi:hypothetical protein